MGGLVPAVCCSMTGAVGRKHRGLEVQMIVGREYPSDECNKHPVCSYSSRVMLFKGGIFGS